MKRVESNGDWTLFCPDEAPGLHEVWGDEFEALYHQYEKEGRGRQTIKAQALWYKIIEAQIEAGVPYMVYKVMTHFYAVTILEFAIFSDTLTEYFQDACNRKSNQQNLGTIKCSNLCTEIVEYSSPDEVAVCNLASLSLPAFVKQGSLEYDFEELHRITKIVTLNLNRVNIASSQLRAVFHAF